MTTVKDNREGTTVKDNREGTIVKATWAGVPNWGVAGSRAVDDGALVIKLRLKRKQRDLQLRAEKVRGHVVRKPELEPPHILDLTQVYQHHHRAGRQGRGMGVPEPGPRWG